MTYAALGSGARSGVMGFHSLGHGRTIRQPQLGKVSRLRCGRTRQATVRVGRHLGNGAAMWPSKRGAWFESTLVDNSLRGRKRKRGGFITGIKPSQPRKSFG